MADELTRLVAVLEADLTSFTKGMDQAQQIADKRFGQIEQRMAQTEGAFTKSFGNLASLASKFGVALSVTGIANFAKDVVLSTASLAEQAARIGVTTDALQSYHAAAVLAGVGADAGDAALQRFTRSLGTAAEGQNATRKAFQDLGLSAADLAGGPEKALPKVATALLQIHDVTQRARIEVALFGKSGQETEALLRSWADPDLISRMKELGYVIDKSLIEQAEKASIAWHVFWLKFNADMATGFVPMFGVFSRLDAASKGTVAGNLNVDPRTKALQGISPLAVPGGPQGKWGPTADDLNNWKGVNKNLDAFIASQRLAGDIAKETSENRKIDLALIAAAQAKLRDEGKEGEVTLDSMKKVREELGDTNVTMIETLVRTADWNKLLGEGADRIKQIKEGAGTSAWNVKFLADIEKLGLEKKPADIMGGIRANTESQTKGDEIRLSIDATTTQLEEQADAAALLPREREKELAVIQEIHRWGAYLTEDDQERIRDAIELRQRNEDISQTVDAMQNDTQSWLKNFETTGKLSFSKLFQSILSDWEDLLNKMIANDLFQSIFGASKGGTAGGLLGLGSILGFAGGGNPPVNRPSIVGENGPELFVPRVPGTIIPAGAASSGGGTMRIELSVQPTGEFNARVANVSRGAAADLIVQYDKGLPRRVQQISSDPWRS